VLFVQVPILGTNPNPTLWTFALKCEPCLTDWLKESVYVGIELTWGLSIMENPTCFLYNCSSSLVIDKSRKLAKLSVSSNILYHAFNLKTYYFYFWRFQWWLMADWSHGEIFNARLPSLHLSFPTSENRAALLCVLLGWHSSHWVFLQPPLLYVPTTYAELQYLLTVHRIMQFLVSVQELWRRYV